MDPRRNSKTRRPGTAPGSEPAEVGRTGIAIAEDLDLQLNENNHDGSTQDQGFEDAARERTD